MNVKITSDSTCDLSRELIEQYGIDIVPLYVVMNEKAYKDGLEIVPQDVFDFAQKTGKAATTAAVNVEDYLAFFRQQLEGHDALVHFTISSEMSCCYQNACLAAQELENVYIIDSASLSTGIGQLVLEAASLAADGKSVDVIVKAVNEKKELLDVSFVLNTLEFLRMGGRCSSLAALGANLLGLKPCIEVCDGKMGVAKKYRGSLEKALQKYVADRLSDVDSVDDSRVFITDSGVSDECFEIVRTEVLKHVSFKDVFRTRAGCTISNHCGPNCLGILFFRKQKV